MKKLIASVGLAAVGTATLSAQYAPGLTRMETAKPWSISGSLRGFYDDNINTAPGTASFPKVHSWGLEFSPAAALNFSWEQTYVRLGYVYSLRYYTETEELDHSHEFNAKLEHKLSERFKVGAHDSFVYAQEPDIVVPVGGTLSTFQRAGNVIRNNGGIDFTGQITPEASVDVAYQNTYYDYQREAFAALLNRVEHRISIDGGWLLQENLIALLGYTYGINDYTSETPIIINTAGDAFRGKDRNNTTHYFYGGLKRALSAQLTGDVKVGGEYTSYDLGQSSWSPYAEFNVTYEYLPGDTVQVGFRHDRNATDVLGATSAENFVLDQESSTVYGQLSHKITPDLTGSLLGQYQYSVFHGGSVNDEVDNFFLVGANLEYKFTQNISTEIGYNFDRLDSDLIDRSFSRNRVYFGIRASY